MADINTCTFTGRLTRDCETRSTQSGSTVARFSIANNYYSMQSKKEEASFFDCVMFGKMAENLPVYLKKGTPVTISGELRQQRFQVNGKDQSKIEILVDNLRLFPKQEETKTAATTAPAPQPTAQPAYNDGLKGPEAFEDDDIPF